MSVLGSSTMSARSDSGKINQLFEKINSSNNIEIEERSIKNIAQKVQLGLVAAQDLAVNSSAQIGYLLAWINKRYQHATSACLNSSFSILLCVASCDEGKIVLNELGAQSFLTSLHSECEDPIQKEIIANLMGTLINTQNVETHSSHQNIFHTFQNAPKVDKQSKFEQTSISNDQSINLGNFRHQDQENSFQRISAQKNIRNDFTVQITETGSQKINKQQQQSTSSVNGQQNILHTTHLEILHKNQCLKEPCELPFIYLSEQDEKLIFDISVQLKFGDFRTVLNTTQSLDLLMQDFPVEVFLQRTDTIKALLDLLEGGSGGQTAFSNLAQQQLITLCRRLKQLYRFNTNNMTKKSAGNNLTHEYLQVSYPSCKEGVWNTIEQLTDLKKYGAQMPSEKMAAATLQGSLSCRAVLGLIITKSVYLLKDTEKIGLYIQLIREAWQTLCELYRVNGNQEFTELIHLILFAFDSVCEFYRDQIFEEVLIAPILQECLSFVKSLNLISFEQNDRFKNPFSETFFKNTEKLQMTLRRGLFTVQLKEEQVRTILEFFDRMEQDLPQVNLLQKQVISSYNKAMDAYRRFLQVHNYRLSGNNFEDMCFVDNLSQLNSAMEILDTLTGCIEMKIDFPFEHLLMDCIVYSQILQDQQPENKTVEGVERLFVTYLSIPIPEVRERILRRMFQRVRIVQAFQSQSKFKVKNNYLLAKFCFRKRILNQLVNGLLINSELSTEATKLQFDIGTLIIRILIVGYTESGLIQQKNSNLNSFLLTFQSLLPKYSDLLGLIDLIEENTQQNCRYLRILRDLFSKQSSKREFSTQILQKNFSKDSQSQTNDLLPLIIDLKSGDSAADFINDLDLINLSYDFSNFDTKNIVSILMNAKSDYSIRKSSLEQLTLLLFDQNKRGKILFTNQGVTDVFTFVKQEILTSYNTCFKHLGQQVNELPQDQISYIEQCFKFLSFSYIFYSDEAVIKNLFDGLRVYTSQNPSQCDEFENLLNACVFYSGSTIRKQSVKLLFFMIFNPILLKTKISKSNQHNNSKQVQILIPDFCVDTFFMIVPTVVQVVKQPMRDDLLLSEEQKDFIYAMLASPERESQLNQNLSQVAKNFCESRLDNYHEIIQNYQLLQNYLLSISDANENLISVSVLQKIQEMFRMLPTKEFEFSFLADFCMFTNQILTVAGNISNGKQIEALVHSLCEGLKFHMLPYLYEVSISGIEEDLGVQHSPKILFFGQFLDLLFYLGQVDTMLRKKYRTPSIFSQSILSSSLISYIADLFAVLKDYQVHRHKILQFIALIITQYETRNLKMERIPEILQNTISQHHLSHSFQQNSLVMSSIRMLVQIFQQRLTHIKVNQSEKSDLDQFVVLSQTTNKVMQQFSSSGWLTRFTESRDARLRCLSWDILTEIFDYQFFCKNQSLVHQSLSTLNREGELYCVKIAVLKFVNKLCDCLVQNVDIQSVDSDSQNEFSIKTLLESVNKQGFISQIHSIISQKDCPLLMISLLLKFLSNLIQIDFKRALPILTQLDYWTVLVELINIESLQRQETKESRQIIVQLKSNILQELPQKSDVIYMCLNSVLEFIFQAIKRDSQLANLLVKTTKLLPQVINILKQTLDSANQLNQDRQQNMQGLILICIDKCTKIMHLALLHPRDHTLTLLHNFIDKEENETFGWIWILKMFNLVGSKHSLYFYGHIDVKLALCRFIAEYLLRVHQSGLKTNLDNLIQKFDATIHMQSIQSQTNNVQDLSTYGGQLLLEFGKVFRALYVDQRDTRQQMGVPNDYVDHENSKVDICLSLSILCAISTSAKVQSVEQNLLKKIIEICDENTASLNLSELQRLATKSQSVRQQSTQITVPSQFDQQRKFKYAQLNDSEQCAREVIRMLNIIKHILLDSKTLLLDQLFPQQLNQEETYAKSFVSQNAQSKQVLNRQKLKKEQAQGNMLVNLFGQILEQITITSVYEECLQTMVTMASQNKRFKSQFIAQSPSLISSKRNTVMKIVVDLTLKETFQTNNKKMQLLFAFLKSISQSADVAKEISKLRLIEEIQSNLEPVCKNEKDIKLLTNYLVQYSGFLAGFASTDDGAQVIIKNKQVFTLSLFVIDTVTPPNGPKVTPLTQLVLNMLLFLRNSSIHRVGKQHFISDKAFLPCLMAFLSSRQQHQRVRAYTAACLWSLLFDHQGVKAALNSDQVRQELQLLQGEFQRTCDISTYANFVTQNVERGFDPSAFDIVDNSDEKEMSHIRKMENFILIALNGILALLQA